MARKPRPDIGVELGGFDGLYKGAVENAPETAPQAPQRTPLPSGDTKPAGRGNTPAKTAPVPKAKWGEGRTRNTRSFSITEETFERMRRAAFAEGVTMSELAERAITRTVDLLEEKRSAPYPPVPTAKGSTALDDL